MALSLDDYKRIASETHPDWNDAQKEQWAQSKVGWSKSGSNSTQQDKEEEWRWGLLSWLADWWKKAWTSISWWFDDLISDETAQNSTIWKLWDMALNVVGWVLWWAVQSIAETPNFVWNLVSMPFTDKSEWWWSDVKNRAKELQDDYWMNRAWAWLTAIDENNDSEHVWAQTVFQLLNNPLLFKWAWKALDAVWWVVKWTKSLTIWWKTIGKVSNVADDASKVSKWVKAAWAAEEVVEDTAKTWWKTSILTKIKNKVDNTKKYITETTIWQKLTDAVVSWWKFVWWPITDAYNIIKTWVNTTRAAMKTTWVWSAVMKWVRATIWETIQTAGKFISKPLAYRTPRLITTHVADMIIWDPIEAWMSAVDQWEFVKDHWYSLDAVQYLNDSQLEEYYNGNGIPQNKRLTAEQIREERKKLWDNMLSNFTEWAKNLFEMFDIFSAPSYIMKQRNENLWDLDVERNVRWEFRWFSDWKSINFETWEIKNSNWETIDREDLSADELRQIGDMYNASIWQTDNDDTTWDPQSWAKQTWIESNNITNTINRWAVNWMIEADTERLIIKSENEWVRANANMIITQLNEASKEYVNSIISFYTPDEINKSTQLQQELNRSLISYWRLFNAAAEIIAWLEDDDYNDVYRYKKALTAAYNSLSANDQAEIDSNLYRKAIDYNNTLESWFDEWYMKTATWAKRATDKMLNIFWSKDTNDWFDQWLSWIAWSLINPEVAWWWSAWWEISAWLRSNAAYAVDMVVLNKINDSVVEKFVGNKLTNIIRKNPKLNAQYIEWTRIPIWKISNSLRWAWTEMSSEFLENFTDAISMVEDPNHDYDYVTWLMFWMFQWAMAWYASSTDSYTSFKDYLTRPENRERVLQDMWIYINSIQDPQKKAVMLSTVSQLMDDKSENNLIDIMTRVASQVNWWVESMMQWYALYQTNKMIWEYTNDLIWQVLDRINSVQDWTPEEIRLYFWNDNDETWMTNFSNYNNWRQFEFNPSLINYIRNKPENRNRLNQIVVASTAFIKSSFDTAWMTLEQWINYMAPKINQNGEKIITPMRETKTVEWEMAKNISWDPVKDVTLVYAATNQVAFTIWDHLWITPTTKDSNVYWPRKSRFWFKMKPWFKNNIKVTEVDQDWNETTKELTMKEYLEKKINESTSLTREQKRFIWTIMFRTSVSWLNKYFEDDWSLTKLWEDFLSQVLPTFKEKNPWKDFISNVLRIQTLKESTEELSKQNAMKESWANNNNKKWLRIKWQTFNSWDDISNLTDETELPIKKPDWTNATKSDLKEWILANDNWNLVTYWITSDWKLSIEYDDDTTPPAAPAAQLAPTTNWNHYNVVEWITYSDNPEIQSRYESIIKQRFVDAPIKPSIQKEYIWQEQTPDQNEKRIAELKSKIEWKIWKWTYWSGEARWIASWLQELNVRLSHQQQTAVDSQEQPTQAEQEVLDRLNEVWTVDDWWSVENEVQDTNPNTMETKVPVSIYEQDHQELEWKFVSPQVLLWKWDNLKSYVPYIASNKDTVELPVWDDFKNFVYPDVLKWLSESDLNKPENYNRLPKVTIETTEWDKEYSLVFIWEWQVTDRLWVSRRWTRRADEFRSYILVDFAHWERVKFWRTNTIRPTWKWNWYLQNNPQKLFYKNNKTVTIVNENDMKKPILSNNRILSFTSFKNKKNWKWDANWYWTLSTTLQVERMSEHDQKLAFNSKRVFMTEASNKISRVWYLFNFETWREEEISYDPRNIFTTSDVVFDENNLAINIWWVRIPVNDRSYKNPLDIKWKVLDNWTLQDWFNMLWEKWKTMKPDWVTDVTSEEDIVEDIPEKKSINEARKEFQEIVNTQNDNVDMVVEQAKNTITEPTESIEETIVKQQTTAVLVSEWELQTQQAPESQQDKNNEVVEEAEQQRNRTVYQDLQWWISALNLTEEEIDSININKLKRYSPTLTPRSFVELNPTTNTDKRKAQYNNYEFLNKDKTIRLASWQYWYYLEKKVWDNFEIVSYTYSDPKWILDLLNMSQAERNILAWLDEESIPEPWDLLALEYVPNETIWSNLLSDKSTVDELARNCNELWITLASLDSETLWQVIYAYSQWMWIDYVIERFADKIPSSYVDSKIVDLLISKWVLQRWWRYQWLTLSQIIAYNYWLKQVKKWNIKAICSNMWTAIDDLMPEQWKDIINAITDYYISNYFHLNPIKYWEWNKFRLRVESIVRKKLLESDIHVHEKWDSNALRVEENPDLVLQLEKLEPELLKSFASAAYNYKITDENWNVIEDKPLIDLNTYNYLMESNPYMTIIKWWDKWYEVWPFWSSLLQSINDITEIWELEVPAWNKLQLMFDVYNYFSWSRRATYKWLVEYLNKKYAALWSREPMKQLIRVLENDAKKVWTKFHTEWVMMALKSVEQESFEEDPYQIFKSSIWTDNVDAIKDALIILEANDNDSFQQIIEYAPKLIKDDIYERFSNDNFQERSSNIAYRMVAWLLSNANKVSIDLKKENDKDLPKIEWDVETLLRSFNPMAFVNSAITSSLYQRFWIPWLDLRKWTVILTNNRQDTLWKWMSNFENTERFPLLAVSDLEQLDADVNIIVPNWVSIPTHSSKYNFTFVKMDNAWYHDWALVVNKLSNKITDFENRMYNIFWVYWLWIRRMDWYELSEEQKNVIKWAKEMKSLYWDIFKNNVLPNLSEENRDITQDEFEQSVIKSWMKRVSLDNLYKCFVAWDVQEMVNNSIAVINKVTGSKFKLNSKLKQGKKWIDTNQAISDFSKFINGEISSNAAKERIAAMFWDYLMTQMQIWKIDLAKWYDQFTRVHNQALQDMYKITDIKNYTFKWLELPQLFLNNNITNTKNRIVNINEWSSQNVDTSEIDSRIETLREYLKKLYLATDVNQKQIDIAEKNLNDLVAERQKMLWIKDVSDFEFDESYYDKPLFIELVNEAAWTSQLQDEVFAENSEVLSTSSQDQNRIFSDKAMKILEFMYSNYIQNNAMTNEPWQSNNNENHIVSQWLLSNIQWQDVFTNTFWDFEVWYERNSRYAYSRRDLFQLISVLTTLKSTNPARFKSLLDEIFVTYKDIWYTYDSPAHQTLLKAKDSVAKNPSNLYKVFYDISSDRNFSTEFLEWWKIEKILNYQDVNADALLQESSKEYFQWSPYIMRTSRWIENMHDNVKEYHKLYDNYFEWLLPKWVIPADEQIIAFAKMKDAFDNRQTSGKNTDKDKVFAIPWVAWAWKTTVLSAFFNYIWEQWWADYEVDNIANWKQTSIIYNFNWKYTDKSWYSDFGNLKNSKDSDVFYARIKWQAWWSDVYVKFNWWSNLAWRNSLDKMSTDEILDWYSNIWDSDRETAATILAEKWSENRVNWEYWSKTTIKIKKIEKVTNMKELEWKKIIDIKWKWPQLEPRKDKTLSPVQINSTLSDINFAVRMHQTVSSLKATFSEWKSFRWINYWTEASYMSQDNPNVMKLFWYAHTPIIKESKKMKWKIIIIDEAQNSYNSDLKAIAEQLWWDNVVIMLWDFHQNSKWDYFENLSKDEQYMVETHRWTKDINIMNEINAFTQHALIKANAIWYYMTDSDDFRRYDEVNKNWYNAKPNEYLMVAKTNPTRRKLNEEYLETLWAKIPRNREWNAITDQIDLSAIINWKKTLQVMIADVISDKSDQSKWRKSEMPNEWLNMEWFKKRKWWEYYFKQEWNKFKVLFPSTPTSNYNDLVIEKYRSEFNKAKAKWLTVEIYVPAFAITAEKETWKTVDNIILHDEIVNTDYDHLSESNAKQYYDSFTRWAKKVYIPQRAPRLIWITREDAENLMKWIPLQRWYVERTSDKTSEEDFTLPVITLKKVWWLDILDDIKDLFYYSWKSFVELWKAIDILQSVNLWSQTYWDHDMYWDINDSSYMDLLKKKVADEWDLHKEEIKKSLEWKKLPAWTLDKFDKIDQVIYWVKYQVPRVATVDWWEYLNWREWTEDYRIWWDTKFRNKIVTVNDFMNWWKHVEDWSLINWQLYRPEFVENNWRIDMKLVPDDNWEWITKETKWWIENYRVEESNVIRKNAEITKANDIFDSYISEWISEEKFWNDLSDEIDTIYSRLSDDDLYREEERLALPWEILYNEYADKDAKENLEFYKTHSDTSINNLYQSIQRKINNKDSSDLDTLKAEVNSFINRAIDIDNRETTPWLDTQENEFQMFINESWIYDDIESEENCWW